MYIHAIIQVNYVTYILYIYVCTYKGHFHIIKGYLIYKLFTSSYSMPVYCLESCKVSIIIGW